MLFFEENKDKKVKFCNQILIKMNFEKKAVIINLKITTAFRDKYYYKFLLLQQYFRIKI